MTSLPTLPDSLYSLFCYDNQLTILPELPEGLYELHCGSNQLSSLPELPENITWLICQNNQLTSLPLIPENLTYINCGYNPITVIPDLPSEMEGFGIDQDLLECTYDEVYGVSALIYLPICDSIGCSDIQACNYSFSVFINDNESCVFAEMYYDCEGNCFNDIDSDGICDELDYDNGVGIIEIDNENSRIIKVIDILGREQNIENNNGALLFYIYENGNVIRRINH